MIKLNQNAYKVCIKTGEEKQFERLLDSMNITKGNSFFTNKMTFGTCYVILAFDDEAELIENYIKIYSLGVM